MYLPLRVLLSALCQKSTPWRGARWTAASAQYRTGRQATHARYHEYIAIYACFPCDELNDLQRSNRTRFRQQHVTRFYGAGENGTASNAPRHLRFHASFTLCRCTVRIYAHARTHVHTHSHAHTHTRTHACTRTHAYTHTHTQASPHARLILHRLKVSKWQVYGTYPFVQALSPNMP